MARGPLILAEERNKMLRLELAGMNRSQIARECKRSKGVVSKVLGIRYMNKGRKPRNKNIEAERDPVT